MNSGLVTQALKLHGRNLWAVLEGDVQAAQSIDSTTNISPHASNAANINNTTRQDDLPAQRPALHDQETKRKKRLCQFIAKKADVLFKSASSVDLYVQVDKDVEEFCAVMPPLETFMGVPGDERRKHFFDTIGKGDVLMGYITNKQEKGFIITVLCMDVGRRREIHDLDIKAFCPISQIPPLAVHESLFGSYHIKDLVRVVVLSVSQEQEKIVISMKNEALPLHLQPIVKLGLTSEEEIPVHHRRMTELQGKSYMDILVHTRAFNNPTTANHICVALGLPSWKSMSLIEGLKNAVYPEDEYAAALRKVQSAKWAYKSVKDGVSYFKNGNHTEAFQCLNKALQIDPMNTEALVARGALFANNDNYRKALEDFEQALDVNPNHSNARKYMSETLVALGRHYERCGEVEGAIKTYRKAVQVNVNNVEAKQALSEIEAREKKRMKEVPKKPPPRGTVQDNVLSRSVETRDKLKKLLKEDQEKHKKKSKYSSSSSSSSSGSSSDSSSTSSHSSRSAKNKQKAGMLVTGNATDEAKSKEERIVREVPNTSNRKPSPKVFFVMNKRKDIPLSKIYGRSSIIDPDSPTDETPCDKSNSMVNDPQASNAKLMKKDLSSEAEHKARKSEDKMHEKYAKVPGKSHDDRGPRSSPYSSYSRSRSRSRDRGRYRSRSRSRSRHRGHHSRSPGHGRHGYRHRGSESPYHRRSRSRTRSRSRSRSRYHDDHYRSHRDYDYESHHHSPSKRRRRRRRKRRGRRSRRNRGRSPGVDIISRAPDLEFFKRLKAEKAAQQAAGEKPFVANKITKALIIQNLTDGVTSSGLEAAKLAAQKINETLKSAENESGFTNDEMSKEKN